ncbi:MAG: transcriptional regulator [Planctomycetes bacterium]|nr:transcriptional regulator [Planctomycetota bacterium]
MTCSAPSFLFNNVRVHKLLRTGWRKCSKRLMDSNQPRSPREQILYLLKVAGPRTSSQLAESVGVTKVAIRRHLVQMEAERLLTRQDRRGATGRPPQVWELTPTAQSVFEDGHADLSVRFLHAVEQEFGLAGLGQVLDAVVRGDIERAEREAPGADVATRVAALAALRRDQGYMAEHTRDSDTGAHLLVENHCPVNAAADACDSLCDRELQFFERLLGDGVRIERTDHMQEGDRCCVYVITETRPASGVDV